MLSIARLSQRLGTFAGDHPGQERSARLVERLKHPEPERVYFRPSDAFRLHCRDLGWTSLSAVGHCTESRLAFTCVFVVRLACW